MTGETVWDFSWKGLRALLGSKKHVGRPEEPLETLANSGGNNYIRVPSFVHLCNIKSKSPDLSEVTWLSFYTQKVLKRSNCNSFSKPRVEQIYHICISKKSDHKNNPNVKDGKFVITEYLIPNELKGGISKLDQIKKSRVRTGTYKCQINKVEKKL